MGDDAKKRCPRCLEVKPLTEEYWQRDRSRKTGFGSKCRECCTPARIAWYREHREEIRAENARLKAAELMESLTQTGKKCPKCGAVKPLTDEYFHRSSQGSTGFKPHCRDCGKREARRWAEEHPEENRTRARTHFHDNREAKLESIKRYQRANRVRVNEWKRLSSLRHPETGRASVQRRRVRLRQGETEKFSDLEIFDRDGWICQLCGEPIDSSVKAPDGRAVSLDHILPISRGGSHTRSNVQAAHLGCNKSKGAREP